MIADRLPLVNALAGDLDEVVAGSVRFWESMRGQSLFLTGGTGFVGSWLLESLLWANDKFDLGARAAVLTRDPGAFHRRRPQLAAHPNVDIVAGDVRRFDAPPRRHRFVIHAAAETSISGMDQTVETSLKGTLRTLDYALQCGAERVLHISSGAVYDAGSDMRESSPLAGPAGSPYALGKRLAEEICTGWAARTGVEVKIARCFSFIGPYLPTDQTFAAGNFVRDALAGGPIRAKRHGSIRSYLYAADMAAWLWTILGSGQSGRPYNVGSAQRTSTAELARLVAEEAGVEVAWEEAGETDRSLAAREYVANTERARKELFLTEKVDLREGIRRTLRWHRR